LVRINLTIKFQHYLALGKNLLLYSGKLLKDVHNSQVIIEYSKKEFSSIYIFDSIQRPRVGLHSPETEPQCSPNFFRFALWHFVVNAHLRKGIFLIEIQIVCIPILSTNQKKIPGFSVKKNPGQYVKYTQIIVISYWVKENFSSSTQLHFTDVFVP
jgi:hypothetical protein